MAENQEELVFRCGWTWWRVLAVVTGVLVGAGALYSVILIIQCYVLIAKMLQMASELGAPRGWLEVAQLVGLPALAGLIILGCVAALLGEVRQMWVVVRNWRAEVGADKLRITGKRGDLHEVAWDDIYSVTFLWIPELCTAQGKIGFPPGIIEGRRLFALIAKRARLTERKGSWITGIRLTRPNTEADA